jgi:hypothetical protein
MKKEKSYFEKYIEELKFVLNAMGADPKEVEYLINEMFKPVKKKG